MSAPTDKEEVAPAATSTDCPPDEFDPEEAAEKERKRYEGKNFGIMYYPQGIDPFYPTAKTPALAVVFNVEVACAACGTKTKQTRKIEKWPDYCISCLKKMGFGGPKVEVFLPEEVIMQIMCYLPTFHDLQALARVSRRYLNAYNYAASDESPLTAVKRKLLGKELYLCRKHPSKAVQALVSAKENQLLLAPLLGEWPTADLKRRLALSHLIVTSPFYATQLQIQTRNEIHNLAYSADNHILSHATMSVKSPKVSDDKTHYTVELPMKDKPNEKVIVYLDPETGKVEYYDPVKKRSCCCC